MKKIWTYDEANKVIKDADNLSSDELESLVEFIIGKGIEVKTSSNGVSVNWEKATEDILLLVENLVIKVIKNK